MLKEAREKSREREARKKSKRTEVQQQAPCSMRASCLFSSKCPGFHGKGTMGGGEGNEKAEEKEGERQKEKEVSE